LVISKLFKEFDFNIKISKCFVIGYINSC
jgi:hypothetical protein